MRFPNPLSVTFCLHAVVHSAAAAVLQLNISAITSGTIESDWTTTYHPKNKRSPSLLITNDGGASTGGYHVFDIDNGESDSPSPLEAVKDQFTGRNKLVSTIYDIDGKDYLVSIPKTTSIFSFHELPSFTKKQDVQLDSALGDWSALCPWSSATGNTYLFLLGKREGIQYLVRKKKHGEVQLMEV
jgi:3-phytase